MHLHRQRPRLRDPKRGGTKHLLLDLPATKNKTSTARSRSTKAGKAHSSIPGEVVWRPKAAGAAVTALPASLLLLRGIAGAAATPAAAQALT